MTILKDLCTKDNTITPCFKSNPRNTEIIPFTIPAIIQHWLLEVDRQRQSVQNVVRSSDHSSYNMQLERISSSPLAISRFISVSLFFILWDMGCWVTVPIWGTMEVLSKSRLRSVRLGRWEEWLTNAKIPSWDDGQIITCLRGMVGPAWAEAIGAEEIEAGC